MGAKEVGEPLSINGQFGTITSPTDKCAMRISGIGPSFVGQYVPLQSITVPIILSCDVGRVLEAGPVQVKSGRSGQTVVNGTAMVLAIANSFDGPRCGQKRYPAGISTPTNVRLTRQKSALFQWLAVPLWFPTGKDSVPTDSGHSVRVLLDPAARLEPGARWVNSYAGTSNSALPVVETKTGFRNVLLPTAGGGCVVVAVRLRQ